MIIGFVDDWLCGSFIDFWGGCCYIVFIFYLNDILYLIFYVLFSFIVFGVFFLIFYISFFFSIIGFFLKIFLIS